MSWKDFEIERISQVLYVIHQDKGANIGVCLKDNSALLIDSGDSPRKSAALKELVQEKLDCKVELLFNTHYHSDHTFGNQSFGCPIISSQECKDIMQRNLSTHWTPEEIKKAVDEDLELKQEWKNLKITFPTKTFKEELAHNFKGIKVIFRRIGGHTSGSSVACFPDYKLLFSGDIVFGDFYPTQLSIDPSPLELIEALRKIEKMDVERIVPGHGNICGQSTVRKLIGYWSCLTSECQELLAKGMDEKAARKILFDRCHLEGIPFDQRKHKRNVDTVLKSIRQDCGQ